MRTISTDGMRRVIVSAMVTSAAHGVPNDKPLPIARSTAARTTGWLWPTIIGPHDPT